MKNKIKAAKKGMVLIYTTVILFIATSIVAVLSTFVIVTRNQKIEHEYISRTQIALKSKSYEIYYKIIVPLVTQNKPKDHFLESNVFYAINFEGTLDLTYSVDKYDPTIGHYEYTISHENLIKEYSIQELRPVSLITTINFSITNIDLTYSNPTIYSVGEMRYF